MTVKKQFFSTLSCDQPMLHFFQVYDLHRCLLWMKTWKFCPIYTLDYLVGFQVLNHSLWNVMKPNLEISVLLWMELDVALMLLFFDLLLSFIYVHFNFIMYLCLDLLKIVTSYLKFSLSIPDEVYILWVVEICLIIPKCFDNKSNIKAENIASNDLV